MSVSKYIQKQPANQKKILKILRGLIKKTFPKIKEDIYQGVPWYEDRFYLVSLKDSVNLGFSVYGLPKKYADRLKGKGKYMRHLKFYSVEDIKEKDLVELLRATDKFFKPAH